MPFALFPGNREIPEDISVDSLYTLSEIQEFCIAYSFNFD